MSDDLLAGLTPVAELLAFDVDAAKAVLPAAARDANRPTLSAVLWHDDPDHGPCVVATDGYRMHVVDGLFAAPPLPTLIPSAAAAGVLRHATGPVTATVYARPGDEVATAVVLEDARGTTWTERCVDADFPRYRALIPDAPPEVLRFPRPAFEDALVSLHKVADKVLIEGHPDGLRLWAPGDPGGAPLDEHIVPGLLSIDVRLGVNAASLAKLVAGLATCTITFTDERKPLRVSDLDDDRRRHTRLLMPLPAPVA